MLRVRNELYWFKAINVDILWALLHNYNVSYRMTLKFLDQLKVTDFNVKQWKWRICQ